MDFAIISALDQNRGIGKANGLPWHLSADLKHFAETTKGAAVIMGRKTWDSLPEKFRPLPGRLNLVVSRSELALPEGTLLAHFLDEALELASRASDHKIFVIGGATLYAEAIQHPACTELYLTQIEGQHDCDVFFPEVPATFHLLEQSERMEEKGIRFSFTRFTKRKI